ncbi:stage II sporulation protein M [Methanobrevibacter oralis]|uniref:Stage II sporulation protein M n=1 Tax=Methanobrevibacter oralis TaxID=66851 RepID=A0A165YUW8_METOA|nr:stage II sporulation protein M [Methanobrevibacter oralis]KZX09896.1 hypothetical protein MBORA_19580 [Methanobrevibacter oralis]
MFNLKNEIILAFKRNKIAIISATLILLISLILGYFLEHYLQFYLNPVVEDLNNKVETGVLKLTFQNIFSNNIQIVFMMFAYGIIFCSSALVLAFNGFFTGYYVANSNDFFITALLIIPHGIFEFSSCILACAAGFVLFNFIYKFVKDLFKTKNQKLLTRFNISFNQNFDKLKEAVIILAISCILMVIAGIFEVYITIPFAEFVLSMLR